MIHAHSCCFAHKTIFFLRCCGRRRCRHFLSSLMLQALRKAEWKSFFPCCRWRSIFRLTASRLEQRATNTVVHVLARGHGILLSRFYQCFREFLSLPQKDFNLKDYCYVFLTHWSILAQNCGLIRISFPVVIIKLGCWTCFDCKQII